MINAYRFEDILNILKKNNFVTGAMGVHMLGPKGSHRKH